MLRVATVGMVWADDHYRQKRLGVAMRLWQRKARLRRRTKKGFRQRKMRLKKNCFRAWKIFTQRVCGSSYSSLLDKLNDFGSFINDVSEMLRL